MYINEIINIIKYIKFSTIKYYCYSYLYVSENWYSGAKLYLYT